MKSLEKRIIYNREVASGYFRMGIEWKTPGVRPGQFVMLRVSGGLDPLLRRPLGIYGVIDARGRNVLKGAGIEVLYRVVGSGTTLLSKRRPGETVNVLGPLGNGFPVPNAREAGRLIMVAGGIGTVPFYLISRLAGAGTVLFGGRSKADAALLKDFKGLGPGIKVATEDGSLGRRGLVTDLLAEEMTPESVVYACGPSGMLKAVAMMAEGAGARCLVSLERAMACGIGVCLGCAVRTHRHPEGDERFYSMVCSDGPVFDARTIDWERF